MGLISVLVILVVFVVGFWLVHTYAPNQPPLKMILFAVLALLFIIFLLILMGLVPSLTSVRLGGLP